MGRKTLIITSLIVAVLVASFAAADITRVSVTSAGLQGKNHSYESSVSQNGLLVGFLSDAWNLVPNDFNSRRDVFVHNLVDRTTTRWSTASDGSQGGKYSEAPFVSATGRYICFMSASYNIVPVDTNGWGDCFIKDMLANTTTLVSVASDGTQGNRLSGLPKCTPDGRRITFVSDANNLVAGDTNGFTDIFQHDMVTGVTTRVNLAFDGSEDATGCTTYDVSQDGRYIVWDSWAGNLVPGDTNLWEDVFMRDTQTGTVTRVSVGPGGVEGNNQSFFPTISGNGRYVSYGSIATNFLAVDPNGATEDIFVYDSHTGTQTMIDVSDAGVQGDAGAVSPTPLSYDGRYAAITTFSGNLVPGDTNMWFDVYRYDMQTRTIQRLTMGLGGAEPNHNCAALSISGDGQLVTLDSQATNLVPLDNNKKQDVFVWTPGPLAGSPSLSWAGLPGYITDGVQPPTGVANTTNIRWKVLYADALGRNPVKRNLVIQQKVGAAWTAVGTIPMTLTSGRPATGAIYTYTSTLPAGIYRYRFQFTVGGAVVNGAPKTFRPGPTIN